MGSGPRPRTTAPVGRGDPDLVARIADGRHGLDVVPVAVGLDDPAHAEVAAQLEQALTGRQRAGASVSSTSAPRLTAWLRRLGHTVRPIDLSLELFLDGNSIPTNSAGASRTSRVTPDSAPDGRFPQVVSQMHFLHHARCSYKSAT